MSAAPTRRVSSSFGHWNASHQNHQTNRRHTTTATTPLPPPKAHASYGVTTKQQYTMIINGLKYNTLVRMSLTNSMDMQCESWHLILAAMKGNTSVSDIYIGPNFYSRISPKEFDDFLQHIASTLVNLRVLSIGTLEFTKTPIEATCIAKFVDTAVNLQTLRIERNLTIKSLEEAQMLAQGFRNHTTLRRISLPSLHPSWTDCTLDPLLEALVAIRGLESLQLGLSEESFGWHQQISNPHVLGKLGGLPHLTWLVVSRFHVGDEHVEQLCAEMTRVASPIKILDITKTRRVTVTAWKAVLQMLQAECHLEALDMHCARGEAVEVKAQAQLFMRLNREGRRNKLRQTSDKEEWVDTVGRFFAKDVRAVNILVRESPWICRRDT